MEILNLKLGEIHPYEKNPRHNESAVDAVAASIKEFGFKVPIIIDKDNIIVAGHTRALAAKKLGLEEVPCIKADDLTPEQIKAFRLADNKVSELAEWDFNLLNEELEGITMDMEQFGFVLEEDHEIIEDEVPEAPEVPKSKLGDIYLLGRHRLMCGDSTKPEDVEKLMNGNLADLSITDPPYNVNIGQGGGSVMSMRIQHHRVDGATIKNDNMDNNEFYDFLCKAFENIKKFTKQGGAFYIWHADTQGLNFRLALNDVGLQVRQCLIWNKNQLVMGRQDYQWKHEPCLYGWIDGESHAWYNDRKQTTVINWDRPKDSPEHPTMKPIGLFDYQIQNSTKKEDIVLDLFGGSGTTIMACEQNGRIGYSMELDPHYVDVIIERWENFTGKKAVLVND